MDIKLILVLLLILLVTTVAVASMEKWARIVFFVAGLVIGYRGSMFGYYVALAAALVEIAAFTIRTIRKRRDARLGAVVGGEEPFSFRPRRK